MVPMARESVSDKFAAANSSFFASDFAARARDRLALLPDACDAISAVPLCHVRFWPTARNPFEDATSNSRFQRLPTCCHALVL